MPGDSAIPGHCRAPDARFSNACIVLKTSFILLYTIFKLYIFKLYTIIQACGRLSWTFKLVVTFLKLLFSTRHDFAHHPFFVNLLLHWATPHHWSSIRLTRVKFGGFSLRVPFRFCISAQSRKSSRKLAHAPAV